MNKWISVNDDLPREYMDVLVTDGAEVWSDYFALGEWSTDPEAEITHWMEMPEAPNTHERGVIAISEAKDEETGHVEQYVDIDHEASEETLTRAFLSLFISAAANKRLKKCLEKAINKYVDDVSRKGFIVASEEMKA